ncbi:MAG TPA: nucleotide exchange factor GrpE [Myxococcales bacterium]|nr:nucleotide exchange factor GrpE [Myxococcales bacterium]
MSEHDDGGGAAPDPRDGEQAKPGDGKTEEARATAAGEQQAAAAPLSREELEKKVERLSAMLEESMSRARETQERLKDTHERLLRVAAEFDNFKKRAAKERDDLQKFGIERLLKDFLPVADNLERALDHAEEHDLRQVIEGVKLVQKLLETTLAKHGVVGFSALGQPFDPNLHEALMQQESDAPPGTVVSEMSRGYKLNDRLVRPAAVVVARPKTPPAPPPEGGSAPGDQK